MDDQNILQFMWRHVGFTASAINSTILKKNHARKQKTLSTNITYSSSDFFLSRSIFVVLLVVRCVMKFKIHKLRVLYLAPK